MDWEDLMEWQRALLGGDPGPEPAPVEAKPAPYRVADLPDPMGAQGRIWGAEPPLSADAVTTGAE